MSVEQTLIMTETATNDAETVLVLNPQSGNADHSNAVRDRAQLLGYTVAETRRKNHAIELAQAAAENGADEVVAVGGDGTLNEVVTGVDAADAFERVTVGVIPTGTGNDFATNIGITDIEDGFKTLETGERRWLDIGTADGRPFVNSCLVGIIAEASSETSAEMKSRLGGLAYVVTTAKKASEYTGLELAASTVESGEREIVWEGRATLVLVGNGRRFTFSGSEQANIEDGLLDVTIVEDATLLELVGDRLEERLLAREGDNITRIQASTIELHVGNNGTASFSLDGEISELESVTLTARRQAIRMPVGERYDPIPQTE